METEKIRKKYDFGIGNGFVVIMAYGWASTIVQEWGKKPSQNFGIVLGIAVGFSIILFLLDLVLWRWQFGKAVRSGLWGGAVFGPWAALIAWEKLAHPVWGQLTGLLSTVLVFTVFYFLERKRDRPRQGESQ